ncbi:MAG: PEGA domain-containing protein [Myxococcales bacterium]|nr:PEGA domain-containing protein [Myxococcales bacterium]
MVWLASLSVTLCLALGPAEPDSGLAAVNTLSLDVPADLSKPDQEVLQQRFEDGIGRSGLEHRAAPSKANECADPECYRAVAEQSGIQVFVGGTIERTGPDHTIELYAIDGTGQVVTSVEGVCEICGIGELGDMVGALAARLRPALETSIQPTVLIVDSDPTGAEVWVDGQNVGVTPLQTTVAPGAHELDVIKRGRRTEHEEFEARTGMKESFSFRLARTTSVPPWVPWAALGVGVASLGAGIGLLVIDERPIRRDCNPDRLGNCQFLHDTLAGGVVLTVVGVGLVGAGVGLLVRQAQKDRMQRSGVSRLRLVPGVGGASLVGRF